jgi:hypothetical protein
MPRRAISLLNDCEVSQMKRNVHNIERVIRIIIGLGLISLVFVGPQTPWGWLGVIPLATGIIGWCPPYALLGISTCKTK